MRLGVVMSGFDKWCAKNDGNSVNFNRNINKHFMKVIEECWDHQQNKITKLETLVRELVNPWFNNEVCDDIYSEYERVMESIESEEIVKKLQGYQEYKEEE